MTDEDMSYFSMPANESDSTIYRLGRKPRVSDTRALLMSTFLRSSTPTPAATNFWKKRASFPTRSYGNKEMGNCTRAKQAVAITRMERIEQRRTISIADDEVIRVYVDMSNRLYGGGDQGAYEVDALSEWRKPDLTIRNSKGQPMTIDAFVQLNASNAAEIRHAIWAAQAHGIAMCFNLPLAWEAAMKARQVWGLPDDPGLLRSWKWQPGSWGGHCIAGDSEIPLLRGGSARIADLVGEENLWVYGCLPTSQPIPAMARMVQRTKQAQTMRVHIDDGTSLRTTPEHQWMLRDSSYCRADQLQAGDRLMPLRRIAHHRGYEKVKWYDEGKYQAFTHRLVAQMLGAASSSVVAHHVDGNKRNNDPINIALGTQGDHVRLHRPWERSNAGGWFATPAGRAYVENAAAIRQRDAQGQFVPAKANHKVVAVEVAGTEWVYDLLGVNPTSNFAAGSVFVHNSMWCHDYNEIGPIVDHTWDLPPQQVTWAGAARYMDEAHLVIDSVNAWKKQKKLPVSTLNAIISEVNAVSSHKIK